MSAKIKSLERHILEEINKGKEALVTVLDETCAPNVIVHSGTGTDIRGLENFKRTSSMLMTAFPDYHCTLEDVVVEGNKAVIRYTTTGTQKGEFMGIPPTNKKVEFWAIEIDQFASGKIVEIWSRLDTLNLMQQLGIIPAPGCHS